MLLLYIVFPNSIHQVITRRFRVFVQEYDQILHATRLKNTVTCVLISRVMTDAYIALGSNLGDRELNLLRAVAEIGKIDRSRVTALSSFYATAPISEVEQPEFINAALRLSTDLSPPELLNRLQQVETAVFRRQRHISGGPRTMDLDILLFGDLVVNDPDLIIPHPRLHERLFVLAPLTEIAPDLIHPVLGKRVDQLLAGLPPGQQATRI